MSPRFKKTISWLGRAISNIALVIGMTVLWVWLIDGFILKKTGFDKSDSLTYIGGSTELRPGAGIGYRANIINKMSGYAGVLETDATSFVHNGVKRSEPDLVGGIFVFGGSTVEGRGSSSNRATIPAVLEKCLRDSGVNVPVVNAGFSGDYAYQEAQRAIGDVLSNYKPKMLIFLDGRNDGHYAQLKNWKPFDSNPGILPPFLAVNDFYAHSAIEKTLIAMRAQSRIVNLIFTSKEKASKEKSVSDDIVYVNPSNEVLRRSADAYHAAHRMVASVADTFEVKTEFFLQPTIVVGKRKPTERDAARLTDFLKREVADKNVHYYDNLKKFYSAVRQSNAGYRFQDLSGLFDSFGEELYTDSVHYNDKGNELIAHRLCSVVKEDLRQK